CRFLCSSRRRHTRWPRDWSSDVCSSDLHNLQETFEESRKNYVMQELQNIFTWKKWGDELRALKSVMDEKKEDLPAECFPWLMERSEERRVGKECKWRGSRDP